MIVNKIVYLPRWKVSFPSGDLVDLGAFAPRSTTISLDSNELLSTSESCDFSYEDYVHPEDDYFTEEMEEYYFESVQYTCDTCEKDFFDESYYNKHMSEHRTCNLDGCTFTAHEKIIEKHIRMQHSTGLYNKIRNVSTPEDIAKWIEDRKRRYPNKENIEKRYKEQLEKLARGERIPKNQNRFGRDKFRLRKTTGPPNKLKPTVPPHKRKKSTKPPPTVSLINEKLDWNGTMFPFPGTSDLYKDDIEQEKSDFEDEEWDTSTTTSNTPVIKLNNALGALMGAYGSDDEFEDLIPQTKSNVQAAVSDISKRPSDEEPPEEVKIDKSLTKTDEITSENVQKPLETAIATIGHKRRRRKPNSDTKHRMNNKRKFSRQNNRGRFKNTSDVNNVSGGLFCAPSTSKASDMAHRRNSDGFPYNRFRKRKVTLLEKLLENEIRHERNVLLQCVRYVVCNNFFKDQ